jgi:hypothetical protein
MNEKQFQNYQFLEMASILSLNGTWKLLQEKLNDKISKIKENDSLDFDSLNMLDDSLSEFDQLIAKINSHAEEPKKKSARKQLTTKDGKSKTQRTDEEAFEDFVEDYFIWQHKKIDEILSELPNIFSNIFTSFLVNVKFTGQDDAKIRRQPDPVKFQVYNLVKRFPKEGDENDIQNNICNFDYGVSLLFDRDTFHKQHLMQGFDHVGSMIKSLRNFSVHKHDKDGRKILKNDLKRSIEDPITSAESVGNLVTLCSALTLCSYQFDEIIQTWIDTDTFSMNKN